MSKIDAAVGSFAKNIKKFVSLAQNPRDLPLNINEFLV